MISAEKLRKFLPIICAGALIAISSATSENLLSIRSSVDGDSPTVGDSITYLIDLSYSADLPEPQVDVSLEEFEVRNFNRKRLDSGKAGIISEELSYVIAAYDTGIYVIPPALASFVTAQGDSGYVLSDSVKVKIGSVLPPDAKDIKDVKPPIGLRSDLWKVVVPVVLVLGLVALALFFIIRRKKAKPVAEAAPEPLPEPVDYLAELEKITKLGLLEKGKYKEFYVIISDLLRRYIGSRYRIDAMEKTTYEVCLRLEDRNVSGDILKITRDFLTECDLVKFAKYVPSLEVAKTAVDRARDIIEASGGSYYSRPLKTVGNKENV